MTNSLLTSVDTTLILPSELLSKYFILPELRALVNILTGIFIYGSLVYVKSLDSLLIELYFILGESVVDRYKAQYEVYSCVREMTL